MMSVLLAFALATPSVGADSYSPMVEKAFGLVVGATKAGARKLSVQDKIRKNEELTTGNDAAADIRFESEALVRIGRDSVARFDDSAQPEGLRLVKGSVRVQVPRKDNRLSDRVRFRVLTPEATLLVAGTEFFLELRDCKTVVKGLDGTVYVGTTGDAKATALPPEGGAGVRVLRGFTTEVDACGQGVQKPSRPVKYDLRDFLTKLNKDGGEFLPKGFSPASARTYQRAAPVTK